MALPPRPVPPEGRAARARRPPSLPARVFAFACTAGLVLVYAFRGGGSYDLVSFEEQGLVIWFVLAVGIALGVLPRRRPARSLLLLLAALAAYAAWTALSLLWSDSGELTMVEVARSLDYLGLVALIGALIDRDTGRPAAAGLWFGAMSVCVIAVGGRLAPGVFGKDTVDVFLHSDRLSYPFGYWNAMAAWGAMCIALGIAWSAHESSRILRAAALGLVPVAATMIYMTYSRAGLFGVGLAVISAIAFSRNRLTALVHTLIAAAGSALAIVAVRGAPAIAHNTGTAGAGGVLGALAFGVALSAAVALLTGWAGTDRWRMPSRGRGPIALVATIAVLIPLAAAGPRLASHAWHSFTRTNTAGSITNPTARLSNLSSSRYPVWKAAVKAFRARPGQGSGAGTFEFWWNEHGSTGEFLRDTHNIWLQNMAELGIPGLLLIVAIAIAALAVAAHARFRARRSSTAGVAAAFLAVFVVYLLHASVDWMWESTAVTVLALAGVAVVGARLAGKRLRLSLPLRVLFVAFAATAAIAQLPGILSTNDLRRSQSAVRAGNGPAALALARDAVRAEPWSASAHEQQALVLEAGGRLQQAKGQETIAISDEPDNYGHWLIRSRIEAELGQLGLAVHDYLRAYQLRPHSEVFALARHFANVRR